MFGRLGLFSSMVCDMAAAARFHGSNPTRPPLTVETGPGVLAEAAIKALNRHHAISEQMLQ